MLRSPWFWIAIVLIGIGVALTEALGVFYWLIAALASALLMLFVVFFAAAYAVGEAEPPPTFHLQVDDSGPIPVVYDCDLTIGWPFRDVAGGLALLYLLGEPRVNLRCVTTTYGSGPVWMITWTTRRLLNYLGLDDIEVVRGASSLDQEPESNRAARRLREIVDANPGEIVLLATGAMTNLQHASVLDPDFFGKLRGLSLLGGVTEPLTWNDRQVGERNFSLDPEAAYSAIQAECPLVIVPGEAGLTAVFRGPQFAALQARDDPVSRLIVRKSRFWFALMRLWFHDGGFAMWDSMAALAITHPAMLKVERVHLPTTVGDLRRGRLVVDAKQGGPVRLVRGVEDEEEFFAAHFAAWRRLAQRVSGDNADSVDNEEGVQ